MLLVNTTKQRAFALCALFSTIVFIFLCFSNGSYVYNTAKAFRPHTKSIVSSQTPATQQTHHQNGLLEEVASPAPEVAPPKYAYVTLLSSTVVDLNAPDEDDVYFVGTRLLTYQLLHAPETRTRKNIPFVVAVTKDVPESKRRRLIADGAQIIEVERLSADWIATEHRFDDVMTKLRVVSWTQFDKILFLDVDTVIFQPLDGVFEDPATFPQKNLHLPNATKSDEGPQPETYAFAGSPGVWQQHHYPPLREEESFGGHWANGGFWVVSPSKELFEHYQSILRIPHRFTTTFPEEALLNYVHRDGGNMPWTPLHYQWSLNGWPNKHDYESGVKSMHDKWWRPPQGLEQLFRKLRWQMDGFFKGRDLALQKTGTL